MTRPHIEYAVQALKTHLDPGAETLAAQDFCHARQHSAESVGEFIHRVERTFQVACGRDYMSSETRVKKG